jgi:hypothetical protein
MIAILTAWGISALALVCLALTLGYLVVVDKGPLGILVDNRGRMSLNHFQLILWTLLIVSLISGVFFGRLVAGVANPLGFTVPSQVLALLGISVGAGVTAGTVKASKNRTAASRLATKTVTAKRPFFGQLFLLEEGAYADEVVDVTNSNTSPSRSCWSSPTWRWPYTRSSLTKPPEP